MKKARKKRRLTKILFAAGLVLLLGVSLYFGLRSEALPATAASGNARAPALSVPAGTGVIELAQDGTSADGGVRISGNNITIERGGNYLVRGALTEGQLRVDAGGDDAVTLQLAGVDIRNATGAAIQIENAGSTRILLAEGTQNRLQSGASADAAGADAPEDAGGAALYAGDDLSIGGEGTLTVLGSLNNGIHSKDRLTIDGGDIRVTAANNALKGKDAVILSGGSFVLRAGGDGIQSDDTSGPGYGTVTISGGDFDIEAEGDGIQAETELAITGGNFRLTTGGGSATVVHRPAGPAWGGQWEMESEDSASAKALKSGAALRIDGGSFAIDARDDALHADDAIRIGGGSFTIASGDDALHADSELTVDAGDFRITRSYEGLEAKRIRLRGGEFAIAAFDDGINANGGPDPRYADASSGETPDLSLEGAHVTIDAEGDGIDSNAHIRIEAGSLIIDGPDSPMNGALDPGRENGGVCLVNGGTVLAVGSAGMAEGFDGRSRQCSFRHNFDAPLPAGSELRIADADGKLLMQHTLAKSASSVVFSAPELTPGGTYTLRVAGQTVEIVQSGTSVQSGPAGRPR